MRKWILAGVTVLALIGGGGYVLANRPAPAPAATGPADARTVAVVKADLTNTTEFPGMLGFGPLTTLSGRKAGTITWLPTAGTVVEPGQPLYKVDDKPVVLFAGDTPLFRKLDQVGTTGPDVKVVNENLMLKGTEFTSATVNALKRWQKANSLEQTGFLDVGDVVVLPGKVRVDSAKAQLGSSAEGELLSLTGADRAVTMQVPGAQLDAVKPDTKVTVLLPDGKESAGTITQVGTTAQAGENKTEAAKVDVTITVAETGPLTAGPVRVKVAGETRQGALTVPVGALVALREGGYAVQTKEGKFLAVQTGLFSGGLVEVSGPDLSEGLQVVTTS